MSGSYVGLITGSWIGAYNYDHMVPIVPWDGPKYLQALFEQWYEPLNSQILFYMLDTTPPSIPNLLGPLDNTIVSSWSIVDIWWWSSIDVGVGLSWYRLYFSLHPSFVWATVVTTTSTTIQFLPNTLPAGTIYWYVESVDYLWNISTSLPWFFHYIAPTLISPGWWWGSSQWYGDWYGNYCPYGTMSSSHYDGWCTNSPPTTWIITTGYVTGMVMTGQIYPTNTGTIINSWDIQSWVVGIISSDSGWSSSFKKSLIAWYTIAQAKDPITMVLPTNQRYWLLNKIHMSSPLPYRWLLEQYYGKNPIPPIGYLTIYSSWLLLCLLYLQKYINKKVSKNLTKKYIYL
jgi:hypothetical protein